MNCRDKPELRERLAAEYALGTLRGRARARLERWMREDAALGEAVGAWQDRLVPMAQAVAPVEPPQRVWRGIEARLTPARGSSFWRALGLVGAGAVAALVAVAIVVPRSPEGVPDSYVAVLSDPKTARPVLVATAGRTDKVLRVRTLDPSIHVAGKSLELWALPSRGGQPKSLGLLGTERVDLELVAAADQSLGDVAALAVSLEPVGGSRTGLPSGPVLYSGACVKYW